MNKSSFSQKSLILFAQEAFGIERETHDAIYRSAKEKDVTIVEQCFWVFNYLLFDVCAIGS